MNLYSLNLWTSSTRTCAARTEHCGRMPWPRLKMCPGCPAFACEHLAHPRAQLPLGEEERAGVEVALHRDLPAEALARHVDVDAPVEADDVRAGVAHLLEHAAAVVDEVDHRHAGLLHARG